MKIEVKCKCKNCGQEETKTDIEIKVPLGMILKAVKQIGLPKNFVLSIREKDKKWERI